MTLEKALRIEEVAEAIKWYSGEEYTTRTISRWLKIGKIKGKKPAKEWLVKRKDLDIFLAENF